MDFKKQAEKLVQNVTQAAEKGTERAKDKLDQTKRQIELKRQLKATEEMLNTAYMEIGRAYASAREEDREMPGGGKLAGTGAHLADHNRGSAASAGRAQEH